jgi:hypothetical protein
MQQDFYFDEISNPHSHHRYWSIWDNGLLGMGGLTNIQWENSFAEISLIINPAFKDKGYGTKAADLLLDQAFNYMGLMTVFGECYLCNAAYKFWQNIVKRYSGDFVTIPNRKYWEGNYHDAIYFWIKNDGYKTLHAAIHEAG